MQTNGVNLSTVQPTSTTTLRYIGCSQDSESFLSLADHNKRWSVLRGSCNPGWNVDILPGMLNPPARQFFHSILLLGLITLAALHAQETRGTIQGRILDPGGSAIPGATIQITNEGTNVATRTQSDSQGDFAAPFLPPGFYRLAISAKGFKNYLRSGAELRIDDRLQL